MPSCDVISGGVDFPFTKIEKLPTFYRNGDLFELEDLETSYEETVKEISREGITERLNKNEPVYLFLYQNSCATCKKIHTKFNQLLFDSMIECYAFPEISLSSDLDWLYATYPATKDVVEKKTPNAYFLLPDGTAFDTTLVEHIDLASTYENYMKPLMNLCSIYSFTKYDRLTSYLDKTKSLVYLYNTKEGENDFYEVVVKGFDAKKVNKPVAKVDISEFSSEELSSMRSKFGETLANHVFYSEKDKEIGPGQSLAEASEEEGLLTKYYSKVIMN